MLNHAQLKEGLAYWLQEPERDLTQDLPANILVLLEKQYLMKHFYDDVKADVAIIDANANKQLVLDLKIEYPNTTP